MGKRGPRREPITRKRAKGNPGHRKLDTDEPVSEAGMPAEPEGMTDGARAVWRQFGPRLAELGILTPVDGPAYRMLCESWAVWQDALRMVREPGSGRIATSMHGVEVISARHKLERQARQDAIDLLSAFGMTPSGRSGLKVAVPEGKSELETWIASRMERRALAQERANAAWKKRDDETTH